MSEKRLRSRAERHAEIQVNAAALGIDEAFISKLVDRFYSHIRADDRIGPIFEAAIGEDWAPHLQTMKDFWASVALNAGRYSGKPVPAHALHRQIQPADFKVWLSLFEETLHEVAPTPGAVPYFMERAERIAQSLQLALFGLSGSGETRGRA